MDKPEEDRGVSKTVHGVKVYIIMLSVTSNIMLGRHTCFVTKLWFCDLSHSELVYYRERANNRAEKTTSDLQYVFTEPALCQVLNEQRANGQQHLRNRWTMQANAEPHRIQTVLKRQTTARGIQ